MEQWSMSILFMSVALCFGQNKNMLERVDTSLSKVESTILKEERWNVWQELRFTSRGILRVSENGNPKSNVSANFFNRIRKAYTYCDFLTTHEPWEKHYMYVPAVCVVADDCLLTTPLALTEWGKTTCRDWANSLEDLGHVEDRVKKYVCCPLNSTKEWQKGFGGQGDRRYREFREIPSDLALVPNIPYGFISGRNYRYLDPERQKKVRSFLSNNVYKPFENRKTKVCGFAKGEYLGLKVPEPPSPFGALRKVHLWYPYLCVKPEQCGKAQIEGVSLPKANPLWHQLCQERFQAVENRRFFVDETSDRYSFPVEPENTHCCHINDIGELYLKKASGGYVATPQIPNFFRLAPGLRSIYKCEEYSKHACDGVGGCTEDSFNPPKPGENPHMATLGVIAPRIMNFYCGGALVSLRYILSAASCKRHWGYDVNIVMLGEFHTSSHDHRREKFYIIVEILQAFGYPPAFRKKPWQDKGVRSWSDEIDLALYRTDVEVEISPYIRPACLYHGHRTWTKYPQFIGWGSNDTYRSDYLETLTMLKRIKTCLSDYFYQDEKENPFYGRFGAQQHGWEVCLKNPPEFTGKLPPGHGNPCYMDHGGPLQEKLITPFCSTLLMGTLSSQSHCKRLIPSAFINITIFLDALEDELWGSNLFIDLPAEYLELPACGSLEGPRPNRSEFFFFNKCQGGEDCDNLN